LPPTCPPSLNTTEESLKWAGGRRLQRGQPKGGARQDQEETQQLHLSGSRRSAPGGTAAGTAWRRPGSGGSAASGTATGKSWGAPMTSRGSRTSISWDRNRLEADQSAANALASKASLPLPWKRSNKPLDWGR
jgi:hypothetical protein